MTGKKTNYNIPFTSEEIDKIEKLQKYYLDNMQITISKTQLIKTALRILYRQFYPNLK
tara:strand:- start:140 stop:313 length:174 start_codon:yes stop_codon:yes gene_type:complete